MAGDNGKHEKLLVKEAEEVKVDNVDGVELEEALKVRIWNETKKMWVVAGPAMLTVFSTLGVSVISQAFIGHIGPIELAAYALVQTVLLRFATGILLGMASGLETLCGQAYGANEYHMLGIYLQRSWIVLTTVATLLLPVYIYTGPILKALGQDPAIAEVAETIALWFIPIVYSFVVSFTCQMFLQAQSKNVIITYLSLISLSIHVFLSWLLTVKYKFGLTGAMVSTVLAFWIPNIGQLLFILCGGCKETWKGFSFLAWKDLWPVIKLSVSSGVMLCLELWYNSCLILLTGNLINAEVAIDALSICLNINGFMMMMSLGFMAAASVRVSNELGRGSAKAAIFSVWNIVLTSFAIGLVVFIFTLVFRGRMAYLFTENSDVASEVAHLSPLLSFSILLNSVQPVLSGKIDLIGQRKMAEGVAVGAGWQSIVAYINLGSYYIAGIPVGILLGYIIKLQVEGVWTGMILGTGIQTLVLIIITCKTDWNQQVANARRRMSKWHIEDEHSVHSESTSA